MMNDNIYQPISISGATLKELDQQFKELASLKWKPWVGEAYSNLEGAKLLVVGESHYTWIDEKSTPEIIHKQVNGSRFTRDLIKQFGVNGKELDFLRNIERTLFNKRDINQNQRKTLWQSVSFYNFIQRPLVSRGNKDRPTDEDWLVGWSTFFDVINVLQPDFILFCGVEAANKSAGFKKMKSTSIYNYREGIKRCRKIGKNCARIASLTKNTDTRVPIYFIKHPSQYFSWVEWAKFVKDCMPGYVAQLKQLSI